jgi:hypothetical protein
VGHDADVAYLGERVCGGHFNPYFVSLVARCYQR